MNISQTQIDMLMKVKYPGSNTLIINDSNPDIAYQVLSLARKIGFEATLDLMKGESILREKQLQTNALIDRDEGKSGTPSLRKKDIDEIIMYGATLFSDVYRVYQTNAKILREPTLSGKGAMDCIKCGSDNTTTTVKQVRCADENSTSFNRCKVCNTKWKT